MASTLTKARNFVPLKHITHSCFNCGYPTKYPLIARESDIQLFERLIETALKVMDKYGIQEKLLAEIKAELVITIAMKGLSDESEIKNK